MPFTNKFLMRFEEVSDRIFRKIKYLQLLELLFGPKLINRWQALAWYVVTPVRLAERPPLLPFHCYIQPEVVQNGWCLTKLEKLIRVASQKYPLGFSEPHATHISYWDLSSPLAILREFIWKLVYLMSHPHYCCKLGLKPQGEWTPSDLDSMALPLGPPIQH